MAGHGQYIQIKKDHDHWSKLREFLNGISYLQKIPPVLEPKCQMPSSTSKGSGQQFLSLQPRALQVLCDPPLEISPVTSRLAYADSLPSKLPVAGQVAGSGFFPGREEERGEMVHTWVHAACKESWMVAKT